jgi:2-oxoglutarate ferredoxin oxidoreductase subunit beta
VIVVTGDGDASAIGGNHLIHTARRNIDITMVVFNNNIYGMTGGQYSPTTPTKGLATTSPYGNIDKQFDICNLAGAAGATYVGRSTVFHVPAMIKLIERAISNKGFSLVDAISICPTYYGRRNRKGSAVDMMEDLKNRAVDVRAAITMTPEQLQDKIIIGEFKNSPEPEYTQEYMRIVEASQKGRG